MGTLEYRNALGLFPPLSYFTHLIVFVCSSWFETLKFVPTGTECITTPSILSGETGFVEGFLGGFLWEEGREVGTRGMRSQTKRSGTQMRPKTETRTGKSPDL